MHLDYATSGALLQNRFTKTIFHLHVMDLWEQHNTDQHIPTGVRGIQKLEK